MARHLVWDWNGTLLDDTDLVLTATNDVFASCAAPAVTVEEHRRLFRRPVAAYYAEVLGRPVDADEFARLDKVFHDSYLAGLAACRLAADALDALRAWSALGGTQSLLSMWFHRQLVGDVARHEIPAYFTRVDGLRAPTGGGSKTAHLVEHLDALGVAGPDCVLVGDSVDDADAAAAAGADCVLVSCGTTDSERLRGTGFPVVDSLRTAVTTAGTRRRRGPAGGPRRTERA